MSRLELLERAKRLNERSRSLRDQHDALLRKLRRHDKLMLEKANKLWNDSIQCAERAAYFQAEAFKMETA